MRKPDIKSAKKRLAKATAEFSSSKKMITRLMRKHGQKTLRYDSRLPSSFQQARYRYLAAVRGYSSAVRNMRKAALVAGVKCSV